MTSLNRRSLLWAMALSMLAGYVDAVGFSELGGYFVSFMSGNTTRLGIAIGDGRWHQAGVVAGLIGFFVVGVVLGSLLAARAGERRRAAILLFVFSLLTASALCFEGGLFWAGTALVLLAMGAENTVLRRDGVVVGLTYMTGNLVRMGHSIADALCGGSKRDWLRYFFLWSALALGATIGAFSYRAVGIRGLWLGSAIALFLALVAARKQSFSLRP